MFDSELLSARPHHSCPHWSTSQAVSIPSLLVCWSFSLFLPQSLETALKYCNYVFTSTFVIEASLKLVAFGFRRFFKDRYEGGAVSYC